MGDRKTAPANGRGSSRKRSGSGKGSISGIPTLEDNGYEYQYRSGRIRLSSLIVLPQPRKTFRNITRLAEDIARKQMMKLPIVAAFRRPAFEDFLSLINAVWETSFCSDEFQPTVERSRAIYYVLLDGERRCRAALHLWQVGCSRCRATPETRLKPGQCFRKHFGGDRLEVRLCDDIPSWPSMFIQSSANMHHRVPEHEEAKANYRMYRVLRSTGKVITVSAFARHIGRAPDTVRRQLQYCELPMAIQERVEQGIVRYGIALELVKLQQLGMDEEQLCGWMLQAITKPYGVPEFRQTVDKHVFDQLHGQLSLFDILSREQDILARRMAVKRVVEQNTINSVWLWIHYVEKVLQLLEEGLLGTKDSPFSRRSPRRVLQRLIGLQTQILGHSVKLLPASEAESASVVLAKLIELEPRLDAAGVLED